MKHSPRPNPTAPAGASVSSLWLALALIGWELALLSLLGNGEPLQLGRSAAALVVDFALLLPLSVAAVWCARRRPESSARLSAAAAGALLFVALLAPLVLVRDALSLAAASAKPAAGAGRFLCSAQLELATGAASASLSGMVRSAFAQALILHLPVLPLLLLVRMRKDGMLPLLLAAVVLLTCAKPEPSPPGRDAADAGATEHGCASDAKVRHYAVSAIDVVMTLNRFGDHDPKAFMYVLDSQLAAVREQERKPLPSRVTSGLRRDAISPLVLRANLGECLVVTLTNRLQTGPVSMHFHGIPHTASNAGGNTGQNGGSFAEPGAAVTYVLPIPSDAAAERAYHIHDHGASRQRMAHGLFGALVVEPRGATYLDPDSGGPLLTNSWEAIIRTPGADRDFREHVLIYHEVGDENFDDIRDASGRRIPVVDDLSGTYRPGSRAINYRSEPFRDRLRLVRDESLAYSSYAFGDPATPIARSYLGEPTKQRLVHAGSEVFHIHHLHGGGNRWKRNPRVGPSLFALGLNKAPPEAVSLRVDSQSLGPGASWNADIECGAGGCQQAAGDFLFHCHIQHHYLAGMWAIWRVFDTRQPDLAPLPDRAPPPASVDSRGLVGRIVEGKRLVPRARFQDPHTERVLEDFIELQLPPRGARLDDQDAAVWDWTRQETAEGPLYLGEPEAPTGWANFAPDAAGQRPVIRFNPVNGRFAYPLLRPHLGKRPPFPGNGHSPAPWLGELGTPFRPDGLCPDPNLLPGAYRRMRVYPISLIETPIAVSRTTTDEDGLLLILNEDRSAIQSGAKPKEPLVVRTNQYDCAEVVFTNEVSQKKAKSFRQTESRANIHTHFVQFDPQGSDGVDTGFNFESTVFNSKELENRKLLAVAEAGATQLRLSNVDKLRPGVFLAVGIGEGLCGDNPERACTEIRKILRLSGDTLTLDRPLQFRHPAGQYAGVEFARYLWYSDVDDGTVFFHDHVTPGAWAHGAFGAMIVEPPGSSWRDPATGEPVRSGTRVDIHAPEDTSIGVGQRGSFREFFVGLSDEGGGGDFREAPLEGTVNLRGEPLAARDLDGGYMFSSVVFGDPATPLLRAYVGDDVVFRGLGVVNQATGLRLSGHRFRLERFLPNAPLFDTALIGVSERFDLLVEGGAGGVQRAPGDYLYYQSVHRQLVGGAWGLFRVHDRLVPDLRPLPNTQVAAGPGGFPQLRASGALPPIAASSEGSVCPAGARVHSHDVRLSPVDARFNEEDDDLGSDGMDLAFVLANGSPVAARPGVREPLVLRVNEGDCLRVRLTNGLAVPAGFHLGELPFDPRTSYGVAVGLNPDSSVAPGGSRVFEFFADDARVGAAIAINLAAPASILRGAFAVVVVEPRGAVFHDPWSGRERPDGVASDVVGTDGGYREFVLVVQDEDRDLGDNTMPYHDRVRGVTGINYASDPLDLRVRVPEEAGDPVSADAFSSRAFGDPRNVFTAHAGDPVLFRFAQAGGEQEHVLGVEGHRFPLARHVPNSVHHSGIELIPGISFDAEMTGRAGGAPGLWGDYLVHDQRTPFLEAGLWGVFRVLPRGQGGPRLLPR